MNQEFKREIESTGIVNDDDLRERNEELLQCGNGEMVKLRIE